MNAHPLVIAGCAVLLLLCGCSGGDSTATSGPGDVILITFDTTRSDRTSLGGHRAAENPALDELAADGVVFERAYAPVPVTLPSHASLLTGRSPVVHGIRQNGTTTLHGSLTSVTSSFKTAGFATAAFVSAVVLDPRFGLDVGFDSYDCPATVERPAAATTALACSYLAGLEGGQRAFLWVHYYDPHLPHQPLPRFRHLDPYDAEIAAADHALGQLLTQLRKLGRYDAATILVTSDHGEGLGDHLEEEHGMFLYEESVRVPFVIKLPGNQSSGGRVGQVVRLIDVAPTLLALNGLPPLGSNEGRDLTPVLSARPLADVAAYAETWVPLEAHGFAPIAAWIEQDWKFVAAPQAELYDLREDSRETNNVLQREGPTASRMSAALNDYRDRLAGDQVAGEEVTLDAEQRSQLEQLGYIGAGAADDAERIDPKDGIRIFNQLREASRLIEFEPQLAMTNIERIFELDPRNRGAMIILERALLKARRNDQAIRRWEQFLDADSRFLEGWLRLGALHGQTSPTNAARCFSRAVSIEPRSLEASYNLAQALRDLGDEQGALRSYETALAIDRTPQTLNALAWHLATAATVQDGPRAIDLAREAVSASPRNADYLDTLAEALSIMGQHVEALEIMERATSLSPTPQFRARLEQLRKRVSATDRH